MKTTVCRNHRPAWALFSVTCLAAWTFGAEPGGLTNGGHMLMVDGQPRFLLGLYENPKDDAVLKEAVDAGFNLIQCPADGKALDRVEKAGAKAWVNLGGALDLSHDRQERERRLAEVVQQVGQHPALLLWEGPDETLWNHWWVTMETIRSEMETMRKTASGTPGLEALHGRARESFERGLYAQFEQARAAFWNQAGQPPPNPSVRMEVTGRPRLWGHLLQLVRE